MQQKKISIKQGVDKMWRTLPRCYFGFLTVILFLFISCTAYPAGGNRHAIAPSTVTAGLDVDDTDLSSTSLNGEHAMSLQVKEESGRKTGATSVHSSFFSKTRQFLTELFAKAKPEFKKFKMASLESHKAWAKRYELGNVSALKEVVWSLKESFLF